MPPFAGGTAINTIERCGLEQKYLRVTAGPQRGRYVHQLVAEAKLGRALLPNEEVDHDDGDTFNNHYENLIVRDKSEHAKLTRRRQVIKRQERRLAERAAISAAENDPVPF